MNKTSEERFWDKVDKSGDCWLWTGGRVARYGSFSYGHSNSKRHRAHRYSWFLRYGSVPSGKHVLHSCDTPLCVRPSHLFVGTQADNNRDMRHKDRDVTPFGEGVNTAVLTEKKAAALYALKGAMKGSDAGLLYGVNQHIVNRLWRKETWRHIHARN